MTASPADQLFPRDTASRVRTATSDTPVVLVNGPADAERRHLDLLPGRGVA